MPKKHSIFNPFSDKGRMAAGLKDAKNATTRHGVHAGAMVLILAAAEDALRQKRHSSKKRPTAKPRGERRKP